MRRTIECRLFGFGLNEVHNSLWIVARPVEGGGDSDAVSGKISELVRVFLEASRTLKSIFLNNKDAKKFKNHPPLFRMYRFDFLDLSKKLFISWHCPFKELNVFSCSATLRSYSTYSVLYV
jgi:hypothetical protein